MLAHLATARRAIRDGRRCSVPIVRFWLSCMHILIAGDAWLGNLTVVTSG